MAANTSPIFTLTPNVGRVSIGTTDAQVKSNGTSAGTGTDNTRKAFTAGSNGSFVDRVMFFSVASAAATTGVATVLRVYLSTVNSAPSATAATDTFLLGEIAVPAVNSSQTVNAGAPYVIQLGIPIPTGTYILVSQHVAQTTNQNWNAVVFGGDF
jgi:hypothetical protein